MIVLENTSDKIQVTTDASADIEVSVSYADLVSGAVTGGGTPLASITSATTVDVAAGLASGQRGVEQMSFRNNHASTSCTVTITHTDGTNPATIAKAILLAGEVLEFAAGHWTHFDSNMGAYPAVLPVATQTEQEAGTSLVKTVTPGTQHFHPSAVKCWGKANGAGTSLLVSYNVTGISDTGTGRLGVTIATDFSSADYSITYGTERTVTALTATGVEGDSIRNASPAAGSFEIESFDHTATTFAAQDPQNYFWQCCGDL